MRPLNQVMQNAISPKSINCIPGEPSEDPPGPTPEESAGTFVYPNTERQDAKQAEPTKVVPLMGPYPDASRSHRVRILWSVLFCFAYSAVTVAWLMTICDSQFTMHKFALATLFASMCVSFLLAQHVRYCRKMCQQYAPSFASRWNGLFFLAQLSFAYPFPPALVVTPDNFLHITGCIMCIAASILVGILIVFGVVRRCILHRREREPVEFSVLE